MILYSFIFFLILFTLIGAASFFVSKKDTKDYLLAGSSVKPWMAALSAVATNNSGYMFIGLIGYTYMQGLSGMWLMTGWIIGDLTISFLVHKKIRQVTTQQECMSYSDLLAKWGGTHFKKLKILASIVTFLFLSAYAAAQLQAGSKALHVLLDWDYQTGAIIGAVIVLIYCFAGGIRASIWTDVAQSFVMFFAMALMLYITLDNIGGWSKFFGSLSSVSEQYASFYPEDMLFPGIAGLTLFIVGWAGAGLGVIGQPHIMVRFMTVNNPEFMNRTRVYYYLTTIIFTAMCVLTGIAARLLIPEVESFDPELALPVLATELLPEILVGVVLAGLFAATMSTADSQILSCTAAIGQDLGIKKLQGYLANKMITVLVTAFSLGVVLVGSQSVFTLVVVAWGMLASTFAPLLIAYAVGWRYTEIKAIIIMVMGGAIALSLRVFDLNDQIFEATPAMLIAFVLAFILRNRKVTITA